MKNFKKDIDVVLLCGGKGQRLRPHTLTVPKPLLIVNKKPFLYFLVNKFLKMGVRQIIIAAGYKAEKVEKFCNRFFIKKKNHIKIVNSGNVDILKRLKDCSKFLKNDFFVCYGDTHVDIDLNRYIKKFIKSKKKACMIGSFYQLKYGTIEYNKKNNTVKAFKEKPIIKNPINLGYFIFKKELITEIKKNKSWISFLKKLSKNSQMILHVTKNNFFSFDSPREYFEIKSKFIK